MTNWTDIHKDFVKENFKGSSKTYQQVWEKNGLTCQDAQEWIPIGFKPKDYLEVKNWKNHNLTAQEVKAWMEKGLNIYDYKFASCLRQKNIQPHNLPTAIEKLWVEYQNKSQELAKNPRQWLDYFYSDKQTKEIEISHPERLHGSLTISNYPQLEKIEISNQNLAYLEISNCPSLRELIIKYSAYSAELNNLYLANLPNLEKLFLPQNFFTGLDLSNQKKLKYLSISSNKLTTLNLNHLKGLKILDVSGNDLTELNLNNLVNLKKIGCAYNNLVEINLPKSDKLEELYLLNNNFNQGLSFLSGLAGLKKLYLKNNSFYGSLEPLKNLKKLESLDISNTDIDSGLEYLPESIEYFYCLADERKDAKVKVIEEELQKQKWFYENEVSNGILIRRWKKANLPKLNQQKLQNQIKLLEAEREKLIQRISDLETLTTENQSLIKEQKKKIGENIRDYLPLIEEEDKKDIQKLIEIHKTHEEAKKNKHWKEVNQLDKQLSTIRQKLEDKIGEDLAEVITMVLTNFEELYQKEWGLQKQLEEKEINTNNQKSIEEKLKKSKQALTDFIEQEKQITENNYLLGQLGKVEELACLQGSEQTTQIIYQSYNISSSSK